MNKVTVVTMGGASSKEDFPPGINLVERKSKGDLVPKLAGKTGIVRPEDLLYEINNTNDSVKKKNLTDKYIKKLDERNLGKIGEAIKGICIGGISIISEYTSIKTGLSKPPSKNTKEINVSNLKIIDVVNKYHSITEFDSGYLKNPQDCKAITDALCKKEGLS